MLWSDGGLDPDLQEVRAVPVAGIERAVTHPSARAHALHVARSDGRAVAHRVLVRKFALEHVADDLHVTMPVRAEARSRRHPILIDDPQGAELHMLWIEIIRERKRVKRLQPTVVGISPVSAASNIVHKYLLSKRLLST